jgi:chemotaxis signal transduction protein
VVDRVEKVVTVEATLIERNETVSSNVSGQFLDGMIKSRDGKGSLSQIVDFSLMIGHYFANMSTQANLSASSNTSLNGLSETDSSLNKEHEEDLHLISFGVYGQEYAVPINQAKEIHGNKYNYSKVIYVKDNSKIDVFCNSCNKIFVPSSLVR